jgi:hypothetical protein
MYSPIMPSENKISPEEKKIDTMIEVNPIGALYMIFA